MLLAMLLWAPVALGQATASVTPEPIYWRQNLLTVPYQWSSTNGETAKSVRLYASKDRGATWQPISDAEPQLLAFNYRAAADGEYWFSIRTADSGGVRLPGTLEPVGAMQPELRVIVDTTMPRIESLSGQLNGGTLEIRWHVADANLEAHSCNVEVQTDGSKNWQPIPLTSAAEISPDNWEGFAAVPVVPGAPPVAVRATVIDLAGNRGIFQSSIAGSDSSGSLVGNGSMSSPFGSDTVSPFAAPAESGWVASSAPSLAGNSYNPPAEPQLWPADRSAREPFDAAVAKRDATVFGTPAGVGRVTMLPPVTNTDDQLKFPEPQKDDRPLGNVPTPHDLELAQDGPFRQVAVVHAAVAPPSTPPRPWGATVPPPPANPLARLVNSRSFALEFELAEVGDFGVSKVELWGTRDGGQTWRTYAVDDDNRSPLEVTVDDEGEYGFSIVVVGSGRVTGSPPQPGDTPQLWVNVDLQPPMAQILSIDATRGDTSGELAVRWEANDDNLELRPISLYYSSRPAGPWTTIATELTNAGEFIWPVERHVPRRIYLKLEARDTAGNVTAFVTSEPATVEQEPAEPETVQPEIVEPEPVESDLVEQQSAAHEPTVANWKRLPPVE